MIVTKISKRHEGQNMFPIMMVKRNSGEVFVILGELERVKVFGHGSYWFDMFKKDFGWNDMDLFDEYEGELVISNPIDIEMKDKFPIDNYNIYLYVHDGVICCLQYSILNKDYEWIGIYLENKNGHKIGDELYNVKDAELSLFKGELKLSNEMMDRSYII